jgi:gliding motility-associated lipoprotein GldK
MKRTLLLSLLLAFAASGCGLFKGKTGKGGELTSVTNRPEWDQPIPFGMLTIPAGSYHMGQNNQDVNFSQIAHNRQITVSAFYMDETEITNNEYRQFVEFTFQVGHAADPAKLEINIPPPNPDTPFPPTNAGTPLTDVTTVNTEIFTQMNEEFNKNFATEKEYQAYIYPDTICWWRDFSYSYNEPLVENYFWHPAFDEYPVVGVNWYSAQAFCKWRTYWYNNDRFNGTKKPKPALPRFRLPTEAEWEYAARGGFEHKIYPWEGPYIRNSRGCYLANFKPGRGDYISDNFEYTAPVKSYWPNDYGLYCMVGNVAEWIEDDFEETGYSYAHDLNPIYRDPRGRNPRRVIRGGSWKDVAYFLSVGTRTYEYADTTKSFIGFRCVSSVLGRSR